MVRMQVPKPLKVAWPPPSPSAKAKETNVTAKANTVPKESSSAVVKESVATKETKDKTDDTKYIDTLSPSESASFHEAVADIKDLRDDDRPNQAGSEATERDEARDDTANNVDDSQPEPDELEHQIPELKSTESEREFEDVLAELNATESTDGSAVGLLNAASSDVDVSSKNHNESYENETESAVQKLIDSIKCETETVAEDEDGFEPDNSDAGEVERLIDSVKSEIGLAAKRNSSIAASSSAEPSLSSKSSEIHIGVVEPSFEEPELKTSNTEQEFDDVLAELNASESGTGSTEEMIGAEASRTEAKSGANASSKSDAKSGKAAVKDNEHVPDAKKSKNRKAISHERNVSEPPKPASAKSSDGDEGSSKTHKRNASEAAKPAAANSPDVSKTSSAKVTIGSPLSLERIASASSKAAALKDLDELVESSHSYDRSASEASKAAALKDLDALVGSSSCEPNTSESSKAAATKDLNGPVESFKSCDLSKTSAAYALDAAVGSPKSVESPTRNQNRLLEAKVNAKALSVTLGMSKYERPQVESSVNSSSLDTAEGSSNWDKPQLDTKNLESTAKAKTLNVSVLSPKYERLHADSKDQDSLLESKVKALLDRKVAGGPKLTPRESIALTEAKLNGAGRFFATKKNKTVIQPKFGDDESDDDIAALDSLLSDDSGDAVMLSRASTPITRPSAAAVNHTPESSNNTEKQVVLTPKAADTTEDSLSGPSSLRANLLAKAKEMVDLYKHVIEQDGFSGPDGEATRHFLTEMGNELQMNVGESRDVANIKAKISELESCVASKNQLISDLRTKNISLRTSVNVLEDELETCKTREKYEIGRLEAKLTSVESMHDSVYLERDELKKWKFEAEVTLKNQSQDLDQLISQNSTLLDLCNEKEEFIKDLSQFKTNAENKIETQGAKLNDLSSQASHLLEVCAEQQASIKDLTEWKTDAEQMLETQSTDLKRLRSDKSTLQTQCDDQQEVIEELTAWKTDAEEKMKCDEADLVILRSDNDALVAKRNEMQEEIEKYQQDIKTLSHKLEVESFAVSRFEEDFLEHSKTMMTLKDSVQSKTTEIVELTAKIEELNELNEKMVEQAKNAPITERENQEKEKITMKMNHHKELSYLKTQKLNLASRVEDLLGEQEEFMSQIEALSENTSLLEKELEAERLKHKETKLALAGMEKALRAVEKKRRKLEQKIKNYV